MPLIPSQVWPLPLGHRVARMQLEGCLHSSDVAGDALILGAALGSGRLLDCCRCLCPLPWALSEGGHFSCGFLPTRCVTASKVPHFLFWPPGAPPGQGLYVWRPVGAVPRVSGQHLPAALLLTPKSRCPHMSPHHSSCVCAPRAQQPPLRSLCPSLCPWASHVPKPLVCLRSHPTVQGPGLCLCMHGTLALASDQVAFSSESVPRWESPVPRVPGWGGHAGDKGQEVSAHHGHRLPVFCVHLLPHLQ